MTDVRVLADAEGVAAHCAATLAARIDEARDAGREIHIALAGGGTPKRAYELLAGVDGSWAHVHLWLGDERCVPEDDPESNARLVRESLRPDARSQPPTLHPVASPQVPEDAAWLYGLEVSRRVPGAVFDVVLLGMGPDGHTCSLFPGHPVLDVRDAPVAPVRGSPKPPPERITLTLPVVARARFTQLLVTGAEKRDALARSLARAPGLPLAMLGDGLDEVVCDTAARVEPD